MLKVKEIIKLNEKFGGGILNKSNLEFDINQANKEKNIYKSNSYVVRAMTQGHPFIDGNKRTALAIVSKRFSEKEISCNKEKLTRGMVLFAKRPVTINKIERGLRRWCKRY